MTTRVFQNNPNTTPVVSTDIVPFVSNPGGTPVDEQTTWGNVITTAHGLGNGIVKVLSSVMSPATADVDYLLPSTASSTYVPKTTTVNGHALSSNVTVTASDVGLGSVENTALSTWTGSTNITKLGTIATGTWQGTAIGDSYISSASTWNAKEPALGNPASNGYVLSSTTGGARSWIPVGGSGTVTTVSVVSANGFAGSVANATTTPAITLTTSITGVLQGNGTSISAASTTGSGNVVLATSPTLTTPILGVATATSINKLTFTQPATGSTLTIDDGVTLHATGNVAALSGSHTGTSSGTNTGDQTTVSGNAGTATALQTARAINGVSFDGTAPITITADASTLIGTVLKSTVVTSSLTSLGTITTGVWNAGSLTSSTTVTATTTMITGAVSGTTGLINFNGLTSGTVALSVADAAGTWTMKLPTSGGTNGYVLSTDGSGNTSWIAQSGGSFAWGATATGTSGTGLILTVGNSSSASTFGQKIIINNTQTNAVTGLFIDSGTSNQATTNLELDVGANSGSKNALYCNFSSSALGNAIKVFSNNSSTGSSFILGDFNAGNIFSINAIGGTSSSFIYGPGLVTGNSNFKFINFSTSVSSASLSNRSANYIELGDTRTSTRTSGTTADTHNFVYFYKQNIQNGAGGTFTTSGSVMKLENLYTQLAGTLTDTSYVLELQQAALTSTHFKKVINTAGSTIWVSDGTTPNGALSGTSGDICLNGTSGHMFWCSGTTTWTQL